MERKSISDFITGSNCVREGSKPVFLNIHDKIEKKGHGPHGLMAGTTGSGKVK